jgi:glutamate formiminotransferase
MLNRIVECVPNFSEGRDASKIDKIIAEIKSVKDVYVLDRSSDEDHNRTVVTFAGSPEGAKEAAYKAIAKAAEIIDLRTHRGEHPRMGAADVVPFVPVVGVTMEECVEISNSLGAMVGERLKIPVFLYERSATNEARKNLANVRKGGFEGLNEFIGKDEAHMPDYGPNKIHPTAGAVAIGAREFLLAYNVNLDSPDVKLAKQIAKAIRESSGGLPAVKALGMDLAELGITQVSMNLVNYKVTGMERVYLEIKKRADKEGVEILESEIIGLIPAAAWRHEYERNLKILKFSEDMILETKLAKIISGK